MNNISSGLNNCYFYSKVCRLLYMKLVVLRSVMNDMRDALNPQLKSVFIEEI